jgi:hypothetical protein
MPPHVLGYRRGGVPSSIHIRGLPTFGHGVSDKQYRLIEDDETAAELREKERNGRPLFRHLSPEELTEALDSAKNAVDAIAAGEHDDVLDLLLFAERRAFSSRVTVIDAIAARHRELEEQLQDDGDDSNDVLAPEDVAGW